MEGKQLDFNAPFLSVRRFLLMSASSKQDTYASYDYAFPERSHTLVSVDSDMNFDHVTEPVAVPFQWEHIPGRAKSKSGPQLSSNHKLGDLGMLQSKPIENDDDDAFSDVSFSMNYSVSGLSGSDGSDTKPSGTFSADPQIRDFMLKRFLPAAKAMTLEPSNYVSKKQSLVLAHEKTLEIKRMVIDDEKPIIRTRAIIPYFEQSKDEEETESEDDNLVIVSGKPRGFLPRFCVKNSVCLLNPVPGMKQSHQSPRGSISDVKREKKTSNAHKHSLNVVFKDKFRYGANCMQVAKESDKETGFLCVPKEFDRNFKKSRADVNYKGRDNFQKAISRKKQERGLLGFTSPMVEKRIYLNSVNKIESFNSTTLSSDIKRKMNLETNLLKAKVTQFHKGDEGSLKSTLQPPLPKCPSESWLLRSNIPSRNLKSSKFARTTSSNTGTKWENIVKTSYLHHDHRRYSEELVANVHKQLRT